GTVYEKTKRIEKLALHVAQLLKENEGRIKNIKRAARLCKSDLVTNMVSEFPELQGVMGREYALRFNENHTVAEAIYEHYLPRFAGDGLPSTQEGRILSISDKIDSIVGCFSAGIKPTGSQDPYALRRQALGICLIILDSGIHLPLNALIEEAYKGYGDKVKKPLREISSEIGLFFKQRLKGIFSEKNFSYDLIDAILATDTNDMTSAMQRLLALSDFKENEAFESVLTAFHRAYNLSRDVGLSPVDPSLFADPSEKVLHREFLDIKREFVEALDEEDYQAALVQFTRFRKPIDDFFDSVMVMDKDINIRGNRLSLLKNISVMISKIADMSKIVD
ncbi:MAG TPA: glycine--tRNA ligase subunit beta, partial [Clostridia bacterium]|nr:glycine--tRNA ligase subunit beta [Clostridia bacterium]